MSIERDETAWPDDAVQVGRIVGAWGLKGGFRVQPFSADPQALSAATEWFVKPPAVGPAIAGGAAKGQPLVAQAAAWPALLHITHSRTQGDSVVALAREVPDRTAAERLRGAQIFVSRSHFPASDPDEFYWVDLIGLAVANRAGIALGTVVGLIETGPHCVLRIQSADSKAEEVLIPFVAAYVDQVDLVGRRIGVDWDAEG